MQGKELDNYIAYFEGLVHLAGYNPNDHLCLKYFTDGLPTGLYQDVLKLNRPQNYREWKEAAIDRQGIWEHINHRQERQRGMGRPHPGMFDPFSSIPIRSSRRDPDAMDTTADRGKSRGKVRRVEPRDEEREDLRVFQPEEGDTRPPFKPREGYLQRQVDMRKRREVQCYHCQQFGHISRFCPQKTKKGTTSQVRRTQEEDATEEDQANTILRQIGEQSDGVKELILKTVWKREDFRDA